MPWMLQPKNYTQIAKPNLYNVAYRRVGTYKGMGRLHPTNYLQIGHRPNMIGATTGQYNTLSGQLSLLPPSLRGLGVSPCPSTQQLQQIYDPLDPCQQNLPISSPWASPTGMLALQSGGAALIPYVPVAQGGGGATYKPPVDITTYIPWIIGGALFLVLLVGGRR